MNALYYVRTLSASKPPRELSKLRPDNRFSLSLSYAANVNLNEMSSDLISHLQMDTEWSRRVVTIKEVNHCDSSFIMNCVLNHSIKSKIAVLIISTHNSFMHYHQVGLKMNYSLQKHVDSGLIKYYNLGEKIVNSVFVNNQCSLEKQFIELKDIIAELLEVNKSVNIIVDGVSHMFDLGFSLKEVNEFCGNLIKHCNNINESCLFFHCNAACEDDVTHTMSNLLSHKAHIILEVESLLSGLSADVNGHLIIKYPFKKFQPEYMYNFEQKPQKYLFKLFDRGVKLFAPGTV